MSAAVAASGGVELWHGVGVTPEAPDLRRVFTDGDTHDVSARRPHRAPARDLSTARDGPLECVALGTPHFSFANSRHCIACSTAGAVKPGLTSMSPPAASSASLIAADGWLADLERAGITIVTMSAPITRRPCAAQKAAS